MCLVKAVALILVVAAIAVGALWYLQPPSGTWVVDRQAMHEQAGESIVSRLTDSLIPDLRIEMTEDGKFTLGEGDDRLFSGVWKLEGDQVLFGDSPLTTAEYVRPGRLTIEIFEKSIIFKRE